MTKKNARDRDARRREARKWPALPIGYALHRWLRWRVLAVYRVTEYQLMGRDLGPSCNELHPTMIQRDKCEQWVVKQRDALALARGLNKLNTAHRADVADLAADQRRDIEEALGTIVLPPPGVIP